MPTLIASANFSNGNINPGAGWSTYSNGSASLSIDTAGGNSIKGICPATDGSAHVNVLGIGMPAETSSVYIKLRAKFRGRPHAIKFCKAHGKTASDFPGGSAQIPSPQGYANCTFGLGGGGVMLQTSFGDGSTSGNDTANVIDLTGASHQLGRGAGLATVLTPQNSVFSEAMWGDDVWHIFKFHVKFNSGNSALNEVNDGEFYVEIDGNVYVNATGIFNRHWANMPIDYISFFDVAQDNDYGYELLYDDIEVSTGGFMDAVTDTVPNPFSFNTPALAALGATVTSTNTTISGIDAATAVSVTGGLVSINGGAFVSSGTITNGQTIAARVTASGSFSTAVTATVDIGGVTANFTATTIAADTTPDSFSFTSASGVALSSTQTSNTITVAGLNTSAAVSVTGGTFSKNGGAYTSTASTVVNGDTLNVRHTASASNLTAVTTTLTVGTSSATFTSTTAAAPDTIPNAFTIPAATGAALNTPVTSASVTPVGYDSAAAVSVTGGTVSINGGAYSSTPGNISPGQPFTVRVQSSSVPATQTSATVTIGGVSSAFTVTTVAADTTIDAIAFPDNLNCAPGSNQSSAIRTIAGINTSTPIAAVTNCTYSINGGAPTSANGSITNGQTIQLFGAAGSYGSTVNASITIGGQVFTWSMVAAPEPVIIPDNPLLDAIPSTSGARRAAMDSIIFLPNANCIGGSLQHSLVIQVGGFTGLTPVASATNCAYSINSGAPTIADGTIRAGQTIQLFAISSEIVGDTVIASIVIGAEVHAWEVTTVKSNQDNSVIWPFGPSDNGGVEMQSPKLTNVTQASTLAQQTLAVNVSELKEYAYKFAVERNGSATGSVGIYVKDSSATQYSFVATVELDNLTEPDYTDYSSRAGQFDSVKFVPTNVVGSFNAWVKAW